LQLDAGGPRGAGTVVGLARDAEDTLVCERATRGASHERIRGVAEDDKQLACVTEHDVRSPVVGEEARADAPLVWRAHSRHDADVGLRSLRRVDVADDARGAHPRRR
jgi:hypothetical protein